MVKRFFVLLAAVLLLMQSAAFAGELYSTEVRQVHCYSDMLRVYVDAEDSGSNPITAPARSDVTATIDGNKLTVKDIKRFGDSGEGVADIFLVDISGSIKNAQMQQVKSAIITWANNMNEKDRIAIITFGDNVRCIQDFTHDKNAVSAAVNSITNNDNQTQLYGGIAEALSLATRSDSALPKRRNIVLITDGINEYGGGVSEDDVYNRLGDSLIPVYSMWMPNGEQGRATLNTVSEYSGGRLYDMSDKNIDTVYGWIHDSIHNSYTVDFGYGDAVADDGKHNLNVKIAKDGKVAEDSVNFTFRKSTEKSGAYEVGEKPVEKSIFEKNPRIWIFIGAGALLVIAAAVILIVMLARKKKEEREGYSQEMFTGFDNYSSMRINNDYGAQSSGVEIVLTPVNGGAPLSAPLTSSVSIGRGPLNHIIINDSLVSGQHCLVKTEQGKVYIEDMKSTNGTVLNGTPVKGKMPIKDNDHILIGNIEFTISFR